MPTHLKNVNGRDDDIVVAYGDAAKALPDGRVAGYLVRFTDPEHPDLTGEYFDSTTEYELEPGKEASSNVYYHHGLDVTIGPRRIGKGLMSIVDDIGVWIEAQLNLRDAYEKAIYELAAKGKLGWSSGTAPHLVARAPVGEAVHIKYWPLGLDASLTPTPASGIGYTDAQTLKSLLTDLAAELELETGEETEARTTPDPQVSEAQPQEVKKQTLSEKPSTMENKPMNPEEIAAIAAQAAQDAIKAEREAKEAEDAAQQAQAERDKQVADAAVEAYKAKQRPVNDPGFTAQAVIDSTDRKYDNYPAADLAMALEVVAAAGAKRNVKMAESLARRLKSSEANDTEDMPTGINGVKTSVAGPLTHAAIKADETDYTTNVGYGDEWIGVAYSGAIWEAVRAADQVAGSVPTFEVPQGAESVVIPVESSDPVWHNIAQAGDPSSATAQVSNVVPAKALGTARKTLTLGKMGSSTIYTGEMTEDSIVPFVAQLRAQIVMSAAENFAHVLIDGDTDLTALTNINDIGGTPAATDVFTILNGFRKLALVTNTANSRSGGTLASDDFLLTAQLLGPGGKVGADRKRVSFIVDPNVHYKALQLSDVKSKDIFSGATIEGGLMTQIYGYPVIVSYDMHRSSLALAATYAYKANTAGKVDLDTAANNTTGSLLAVRWDHWKVGFRRRLQTEVLRVPRADAWEITSLLRFGMINRDNEASAISYNLTV